MALLRAEDGRTFECDSNTFVGRGLVEGISFDQRDGLDREISSVHAVITWSASRRRWELRDLGSQNGTFVDGKQLAPGQSVRLVEGTAVVFGRLALTVVDAEPPPAHAVCHRTGEVRRARDGVVSLPDENDSEVVVARGDKGWQMGPPALLLGEPDHRDVVLVEGETAVEAGGRSWSVWIPSTYHRTVGSNHSLSDYRVVIELRPRDQICLLLEKGDDCIFLGSRVHHELLWLLIRRRIADMEAGVPLDEQGWMAQDEVTATMWLASADPSAHLNMLVYRARQQMQKYAPADYKSLIERHPVRTGTLRIGASRLRIDDLNGE